MADRVASLALARPVTYKELLAHVRACRSNTDRNKAVLNRLKRELRRSEDCDALADLSDERMVRQFFASRPSTANERSALRALRELAQGLGRVDRDLQSYLMEALRRLGLSKRALADKLGMRVATVRRWWTGQATAACRDALERLEHLARFEPGTLTDLITNGGRPRRAEPFVDLSSPGHRKGATRVPLLPLGPTLEAHLDAYLESKTLSIPDIELPGLGKRLLVRAGRYTPGRLAVVAGATDPTTAKWAKFPSAVRDVQLVRRVYTYSATHYGEPRDTLAIMADPQLLRSLLSQEVSRRGGYNSSHHGTVILATTLLKSRTGFIAQLPELFRRGACATGAQGTLKAPNWRKFLEARRNEIQQIPHLLRPGVPNHLRIQQTRDKRGKLSRLLECDDSYARYVLPTLQRLQRDRPGPDAPAAERLAAECDILLFVAFSACPLRRLNWATMKWGENIWKENGEWVVFIRKENLKNRLWLEGDLKLVLPRWAGDAFEHFSDNVLGNLSNTFPSASDYVLAHPGVVGGKCSGDVELFIYHSLYRRLTSLTKRLWNVAVAPHDFRTIYATNYLHTNPGDILTVAAVLNDKPETVLRAYAKPSATRLSRSAARKLDEAWMKAGAA